MQMEPTLGVEPRTCGLQNGPVGVRYRPASAIPCVNGGSEMPLPPSASAGVQRLGCQDGLSAVQYPPAMPKGMTQSWIAAEATLPPEWRLMGVVRGPREVDPQIRSESWVAWARGPKGERVEGQADSAQGARGRSGQRDAQGRSGVQGGVKPAGSLPVVTAAYRPPVMDFMTRVAQAVIWGRPNAVIGGSARGGRGEVGRLSA